MWNAKIVYIGRNVPGKRYRCYTHACKLQCALFCYLSRSFDFPKTVDAVYMWILLCFSACFNPQRCLTWFLKLLYTAVSELRESTFFWSSSSSSSEERAAVPQEGLPVWTLLHPPLTVCVIAAPLLCRCCAIVVSWCPWARHFFPILLQMNVSGCPLVVQGFAWDWQPRSRQSKSWPTPASDGHSTSVPPFKTSVRRRTLSEKHR